MSKRLFFGVLFVSMLALVSCVKNADLPPIPNESNEPNQLVVVLMGDPQIPMAPETPANVRTAMDDIIGIEHDFIAVLGDLVQNKRRYYEDYNNLIVQKSVKPVFSLAGNGDIGADPSLSAYQDATGFPPYYTIYKKGIRFIFLSVTSVSGNARHICHLGSEQLTWLTNEIDTDTNSTTAIFFHAPVFETTWHSEDREQKGFPGSMYLYESTEMRNLFNEHPNIKIYAHGHLHHQYGIVDEFGRGNYYNEGNVLHITVGATANNQGSSLLFIRDNEIVVKVRDHQNQSWQNSYEYEYPLKTTLQPATDQPLNPSRHHPRKAGMNIRNIRGRRAQPSN